ncbi:MULTISPECIES: hypothetical protein [Bradyrhizobium]|uniref:hypothetical protein n=1 Tax=Bradyrhizobium TaxID=374 RepID=UPI00048097A1|nr:MULTISPECIES: hypothetical protein [Bradyrhizobium]QOG16227.1 hypothetical protein FOM02_01545 [Bradyrhizobium sp. SEMIA]UFW49519.1 hypothetical protein BaraCB756_00025 [Bradyrhizobium arachidis]
MRTVRLGTKIPARWRAFVCGLAFLASCVLAATASAWVPHLPQLFSTALTPDPDAVLPAPTRYSYREILTTTMLDVDAPLRTRLITRIPANLGDVLAFYRIELGKRGWQEQHDGAVVTADRVHLAFASPLGPAMLELDRTDTGTSIRLVQRNRDAATKARVMPEAGRAALMFTNLGSKDVVFVLDNRAITLPARAGKERPQAPLFNLPPGKYPYALKIEGRPDRDTTIDLVAGDAWDVTVGPDGELWSPLQLY